MANVMYAVLWLAASLGLTLAAEWAPYGIFFIGSGYNILNGNPQGSKDYGGSDPGLLSTRNVFDFHFDENNLSDDGKYIIPDEMTVFVSKSCTNTTRQQAISGGLEYQKGLKYDLGQRRFDESDINVTMEILFIDLEFTASLGFEVVVEGTRDFEYVYYAETNECSLARASLKLDEVQSSKYSLSRSFVINACSLPTLYDEQTYIDFIELWGTHVVVELELGVRQSERYTSSRTEFVRYAMREAEASVGVGVELFNWAASIVIDIDRFHESMTKQTKFGSNRIVITNGNEQLSEPIKLNLIRMDELFTNAFWTQFSSYTEQGLCSKAWKSSLPATRLNVQRAMLAYPSWRKVQKADNPVVQIPITWPLGTYGLPKPAAGCPPTIDFPWHSGYRYHDTENDKPNNYWSDPLHFEGPYSADNMEQDFCMKTQYKGGKYDGTWPEGSYCIFKKGSTCPDGLSEGYIYWDDENRNNANSYGGSTPEGKYDANTLIEYCCKRDVINAHTTYLPTDSPFYLLSETKGCQKVHGMDVTEEFFHWDGENSSNSNAKGGAHPFDSGNSGNHILHYCYYQPI